MAAALVAVCATGAPTGARADGGFSDTSIGVRDSVDVANVGGNPGNEKGSRGVNKVIFNASHFDVWDYGSNFFSADVLLSDANEASYGGTNAPPFNNSTGSTEFYGIYRAQLSPDKIFGINTKFGPFDAINFEIGADFETENTEFAPNKKLFVVGPNFHIAVPAGFLDIGVHFSKEWNHNGFCADACTKAGGAVSFDPAPEIEFVWLFPLKFTGLPLDFRGFMNIVGAKGKDGFGGNTYTEILARPQFNLDIGTMLFNKPHKPDLFLALELWEHKFGASTKTAGSEEVSPTFGIEIHF